MTISVLTLPALKKVKNTVIGNPSAKLLITQDDVFIRALTETLNHPTNEPLRIEAAHVVASLAYGSEPALAALLHHQAVHAILYALALALSNTPHTQPPSSPSSSSTLTASPSQALISALARALRAVVAALADVVGPAQYGLPPVGSGIRGPATDVLETVFCESLDIYLPLLAPPVKHPQAQAQTQAQIAIAHLLGAALRLPAHRTAVAGWVPPSLRAAAAGTGVGAGPENARRGASRGWEYTSSSPGIAVARSPDMRVGRGWEGTSPEARVGRAVEIPVGRSGGGRGWESTSAGAARSLDVGAAGTRPGRGWEKMGGPAVKDGGWVAKTLLGLIGSRDVKIQEAALLALAALVKDSPDLASVLERPLVPSPSPTPIPFNTHATAGASTTRGAWDRAPGGSTSGNGHGNGGGAGAGAGQGDHSGTPLGVVLGLTKARAVDVRVAACLCATRIRRATPPPTTPTLTPAQMAGPAEDICARTVINVVNRMLEGEGAGVGGVGAGLGVGAGVPGGGGGVGGGEPLGIKVKACFILYHLITDDPALCQAAFDHRSLERLATLVRALTPLPFPGTGSPGTGSAAGTSMGMPASMSTSTSASTGMGAAASASAAPEERPLWEEDEEPESVPALREAALTAIAALALFSNDIRRAVTDDLGLLPRVQAALGAQHPGTRYAACQCVRALSRAVAVLRTNIVDSGLGMAVFGVLGDEVGEGSGGADVGIREKSKEKEREMTVGEVEGERTVGDRRVLGAALAAVCNIVNEFSPLRPIFLEKGLMSRLVKVLGMGEPTLKVSALWAVKNLLRKSSVETKKDVMRSLGWDRLVRYLSDKDEGVQEQAFNVVRNLAEDEEGVSIVFREIGPQVLLHRLTTSLKSTDENVVLQAAYVLANLSNGCESEQQDILAQPHLLDALRSCLAVSKTETRRPAVACVLQLASGGAQRRRALVDAGFVSTLRHLCEWSGVAGGGGVSPGVRRATVLEDDRDVVDQARRALDWLEHGDTYVLS